MKIYLAQSIPTGWGGIVKTGEFMKVYLTISGEQEGRDSGLPKISNFMKLYLATWPPEKQKEQTIGQTIIHNSLQRDDMKLYLATSERDKVQQMGQASIHNNQQMNPMKLHLATKLSDGVQARGQVSACNTLQGNSINSNTINNDDDNSDKNLRVRLLLSYHYYKKVDLDSLFEKYFDKPYPDVFADSGAFSAMTQGVPINIDEYAQWVHKWKHLFSIYANLDVIKDAEGTLKNQQYLEKEHGLKPLPVFHILEDFKYLDYYIKNYSYIALGVAGQQTSHDMVMRWLIKCFKYADGKSVYHGFGLTSWRIMSSFAWYSVDSSSWTAGLRFGRVPLFNPKKGMFVILQLGDVKGWKLQKDLVSYLGFNWFDFAYRSRNDRAKVSAISALSYILAEQYLNRKFKDVKRFVTDVKI